MNSSGSTACPCRALASATPTDARAWSSQSSPAGRTSSSAPTLHAPLAARQRAGKRAAWHPLRAMFVAVWLAAGFGTLAHGQTAPAYTDDTPAADAAIGAGQWQPALAELDARIATHADDVQAQFKRGTVLARMGRRDEAIQTFEGLIQRHPELPEPYNNLAALYAQAGRLDDARVTLENALRAHPGFTLAYRNLGDVYLKLAQLAYQHAGDTVGSRRAAQIATLVRDAPASAPPRSRKASRDDGEQNAATTAGDGPVARFPASARSDTSISTTVPVRP